jgi:hypothetical protein
MIKAFEFCVAKAANAVPAGPDWIHEIKYDGYRARLVRDGDNVKLLSKAGLDWTWRFPFITESALKMRSKQFAIDGEVVVLDVRGCGLVELLATPMREVICKWYPMNAGPAQALVSAPPVPAALISLPSVPGTISQFLPLDVSRQASYAAGRKPD